MPELPPGGAESRPGHRRPVSSAPCSSIRQCRGAREKSHAGRIEDVDHPLRRNESLHVVPDSAVEIARHWRWTAVSVPGAIGATGTSCASAGSYATLEAARLTGRGLAGSSAMGLRLFKISIPLQPALVETQELLRLLERDHVRTQGAFHVLAHLRRQLVGGVLHVVQHLADRVAFDDGVEADRAVLVEADVDRVRVAEQVVQVAEDLLIGAEQERAEVVWVAVCGGGAAACCGRRGGR